LFHVLPVSTQFLVTCVSLHIRSFLGTFTKLQKATISFVMYVCPSVHMEQLGSHWKFVI